MSARDIHIWFSVDRALCGAVYPNHSCRTFTGAWPLVNVGDSVCPICQKPLCARCMSLLAQNGMFTTAYAAINDAPAPLRRIISV